MLVLLTTLRQLSQNRTKHNQCRGLLSRQTTPGFTHISNMTVLTILFSLGCDTKKGNFSECPLLFYASALLTALLYTISRGYLALLKYGAVAEPHLFGSTCSFSAADHKIPQRIVF